MTTKIPVESVDAEQIPREKGWQYDEIARIVGALYLDSYHHTSIMKDQFSAISDEYEKKLLQMQAEIQQKDERISEMNKEISMLKNELEVRDDRIRNKATGHSPTPNHNREDTLPDN